MSMLTEQCSTLRVLADKLRNVHARKDNDFIESCETLFWSMGAMREAADTIESLRDRLQDDVLRGECEWVFDKKYMAYDAYHCSICGHTEHKLDKSDELPNYCKNCGGKAVKR